MKTTTKPARRKLRRWINLYDNGVEIGTSQVAYTSKALATMNADKYNVGWLGTVRITIPGAGRG